MSFGSWLRAQGQDARTVDALWDLVGVATLNARADDAALALAAMVFQVGLLTDRGAADIGWSRVPLQRLHGDAAAAALAAAGVTVRTGAKVTRLEPRDGGWAVDDVATAHVVLATAPRAAEALAPPDSVAAPAGWAARLGASPIVNVHVVLRPHGARRAVRRGRRLADPVGLRPHRVLRTDPRAVPGGLAVGRGRVRRPAGGRPARAAAPRARHAAAGRCATATVVDFFVTREREATFRPEPGSAGAAGTDRDPRRRAVPGRRVDRHRMAGHDGGCGAQRRRGRSRRSGAGPRRRGVAA